MQYMGSKNRHAKEILPIVLKDRKPNQWYVEPFVGGCNMIDKVDGPRIGADLHPQLIAMWKAVQQGWEPPTFVSEGDYAKAKAEMKVDAYTGFVGFACAFGASWFSTYARGWNAKGVQTNYAGATARSIAKQRNKINGVLFCHASYDKMPLPESPSIIYCDPPYANTSKYKTGDFDHDAFWQWCRDKCAKGHKVFVSEYNAPDDWICVWEKETLSNFASKRKTDDNSRNRVEKLFVHESQMT